MSRINDPAQAVGHAADGIRDKASEVAGHVREVGNKVREAASHTYGQVRDEAADYIHRGKEKAQEWEESLESYVQNKPLQAVLIAAGVGLLLGLLWKRR